MRDKTKPWLDEWKDHGEIGQGGQGIITELRHKIKRGRRAVLKRIVPRWQKDSQARLRLQKEAEILSKLHNFGAHVPKIYDSFLNHDDVEPFILMEFIKGIRFDEWLKTSAPIAPAEAVLITCSISEVINLCHKHNIGHRDIKPANIILKNGNVSTPYILDFGIAFDSRQTLILTKDGEMFRNEFIILPECQDLGGGHRDLRSDITALAGIFFACLTGEPPILLRDAQEQKPHQRHEKQLLASAETIEQGEHILWFFDHAFSYRIDNRFKTLDEFTGELTRFKDSVPINNLDVNEQFDFLNEAVQLTDRNVQIAALQKKYNLVRQKVIEKMQEELKSLQKLEGNLGITNINIAGTQEFNPPHVKDGDILSQGNATVFQVNRRHFQYEAVVLLTTFGVGMQIHLYAASYYAPSSRGLKPEKPPTWSKIAILDESIKELPESKRAVIVEALKTMLAREIRNLIRIEKE